MAVQKGVEMRGRGMSVFGADARGTICGEMLTAG